MNDKEHSRLDLSAPGLRWRRKYRHFTDKAARLLIAVGGIGVIVAILMIFLYLFYEVVPLFQAAEVEETANHQLAETGNSSLLHLAVEEQNEIVMRLRGDGVAEFRRVQDGELTAEIPLQLPAGSRVSSFALASEGSGLFALGLDDGRALLAEYGYQTSFAQADNARTLTPEISYPYGESPLEVLPGAALSKLALGLRGDSVLLVGGDAGNRLNVLRVSKQTGLFAAFDLGGGSAVEVESAAGPINVPGVDRILIDGDQRWLYLLSENGLLRVLETATAMRGEVGDFNTEVFVTGEGARLGDAVMLLGGISLIVGDSQGGLSQWFIVREDDQVQLRQVRGFDAMPAGIVNLSAEQRRKNFIAVDAEGNVAIYNSTAARQLYGGRLLEQPEGTLAVSPRGNLLLFESAAGEQRYWRVDNEHPDVSWAALWEKVWYEGYPEPEFIWQSSGSSTDFEPKYSLVPLSFGTLKAAFYAMLLAAPLAICGAIFTGYFMAPTMRRKIKPLIELMEALPTVVLGFLAGLWLAPFVERNLLGVFAILVLMPLSILLASFAWSQLSRNLRQSVPDGWEAALLIPVVLLCGYLSFALATPLEAALFEGDLRAFITTDLGINYDQRNALVVGFAMGFAVIPTIFSIAEDAIFTVPKQLTYGSLALGATPWQSLYRVVLPTASPGIFSGLMIGMGRAVGETMIVLMATGNTPIMDVNIFEGMRTLAANIAVEIPESEVGSTHYRILFLAALVLFMFTFVVNTGAEIVRQRLRNRYSTI